MIILVVILLVLRACHTVHAQVPTAAPSMSPTYSSLQVLFPGRQRVQNLTLAQTTDDVRQIFVTTVLQSLICCETYTIVITSVELESPAARRRVLSLTDGRKRRKRREIDGQILMQEQEHDEEGKNETEEDPDFSTLSSLSALSLFNTAPPVVIFNYTVGFLYTEFNFTDMEAAYTTISSELRFTIIGGGFQRSFTEVRDTAPCYTNPTESADGGCAYLRYSTTTSGSVGDTLIPFPTRFPTSSPTIASTPLDVQGVPFAIVMAIVMILCITAFCYFNYFHKGGSLKWLQRRCIECIWNDEDDDDDFTTDVEDDIEMQNKLKSFDDFGDPDIRFGKGHARERRASMKNVPLKPDFTAAPPEIMKSRQQTIKRYSIVGRDLESEALQKHLEKEKSKDTGSSTNSMEMDSLLGNSSVGAMQKMDLSVLGTLWMTVDEPEPELSTSSSSGGGSFTPFEGVGNPPASIKEEDEEAEQEDGYDPANVPAYIGVTAAMGLRVTNPLHNNTPPRPPPPPPPAAVKRTEAGKNGGANSPMHASANSNVSEVVDTKGPTAPFHPHFAPLRIPHSESDAASIAAKAPVLFNIPATTPALEASPVRVPVSPVAIADVGANENATANDSDSSSTGTDTSDSEADAVAEAEIEEKKLKAYEQAQIEKEIQSRNATFDKIQGNTRVPASTSALTASVVRGTGTNVEVEVEVEEVKAEMFSDSDSDPEVDIEIDYGTARVDNNADAAYTNTNIRDLEIEMDTEAIEAAIAATVGTVATFIDDGNGNDIIASSDNSTETRVTMPSPPPRRESAISIDAIVAVAAAAALAAASTSSPVAGKDTPVTVSTLTPIHVPVPVEVPVPKSKATDAVPKQSPSPLPAPSLIRVDKVPASEPVPVSVPVVMPKSTTPNPANSVSSAATDIKEVFNPVTIPIPVQAPAVASMSANASIWAAPKSPLKSALPARRASAFMAKKFLSSAASASGTGGSFSASANASHRESVPVPVSVPFSASASVAAPDASSASPSSSGKGQLSAFGAAAANRRRSSMRIVAPPPPESQD